MKFKQANPLLLTAILFVSTPLLSQTVSTSQWSTRVWSAASNGNWDAVNSLLKEVPKGEEDTLVAFREQLSDFISHRDEQIEDTIASREEALKEMNANVAEGNIVKAMQSVVKAQTLSDNFDDIMLQEDVQKVLLRAQEEIEIQLEEGNILTAQTMLFYLRTFYEDTSRRDLHDVWSDKLEQVNLQVSLLRQYAPKHLHSLFVERAIVLGDDEPEEFNPQASDNWIERVDGIDKNMLVRAIDLATGEHMNDVSWTELISGGLEALRTLQAVPAISETFTNITNEEANAVWHAAVSEEISSSSEYLKHIPGKRVLIQILNRLLDVNQASVKLPEGVILREFGDGAMSKLDRYSGIIWPDEY
ncbi:MAG: hypothetical protein HOM36_02610, partial [Phycisphaerae bacterium]|nr:hypothetical protein [Phycisphaerae bacterium]